MSRALPAKQQDVSPSSYLRLYGCPQFFGPNQWEEYRIASPIICASTCISGTPSFRCCVLSFYTDLHNHCPPPWWTFSDYLTTLLVKPTAHFLGRLPTLGTDLLLTINNTVAQVSPLSLTGAPPCLLHLCPWSGEKFLALLTPHISLANREEGILSRIVG